MVNMSYQNSELRVKRVMSDITVINYSKTEKISVKNREIWVDQENYVEKQRNLVKKEQNRGNLAENRRKYSIFR